MFFVLCIIITVLITRACVRSASSTHLPTHSLTHQKLLHTLTIYYIHFCHHCQPPLSPSALDGAHTHINSLDIQPIFRTVTSSPACCTKTHIRHYLSFLLYCVCMYMPGECFLMTVWRSLLCSAARLFVYLVVHFIFCPLAAFCHANFTMKLN